MSERLPQLLDPRRAVALGSHFEGEARLSEFARLSPLLEECRGSAIYRLGFGVDVQGLPVMTGSVSTTLTLCCQRCNGRLLLPVDSRWTLALVDGIDEMANLPEAYDPLLVDNPLMRPLDLVEDELILALPPIPRHAEGSCGVSRPECLSGYPTPWVNGGVAAAEEKTRPSPFAELGALKRNH